LPLVQAIAPIKPSPPPHFPTQNPSQTSSPGCPNRDRRAATANQERRHFAVSSGLPSISLSHLVLVQLPDIVLLTLVHQNKENDLEQILLSPHENSGEELPELQRTLTPKTSPPGPPLPPESSGRTATSQIPSPVRSPSRPEHICRDI
jgi:hypothetical protein